MEDLLAEGKANATADELEFIHLNKTAAMIEAALVMGGLVGLASLSRPIDATTVDIQALRDLGRHVNLHVVGPAQEDGYDSDVGVGGNSQCGFCERWRSVVEEGEANLVIGEQVSHSTGERRSSDACTRIWAAVAEQDDRAHMGTVVQAWVVSTLAVSQVGTDTTSPTTMIAGFAICSAAAISTIDSRFPTLTRWSGA